MQVFIYEHISGGGLLSSTSGESLQSSLLREGLAMVEAVAADLAAAGPSVTLLGDSRVSLSTAGCEVVPIDTAKMAVVAFDELAARSDYTLVIAPESEGALLDRCRRVDQCGGRLLGPDPALVEICGDKQVTANHLGAAGVPVPRGVRLAPGQTLPADFSYPAVIKLNDGCGSQNVRLIRNVEEAMAFGAPQWPARLEQFYPGLAASVAVLCGPKELCALSPCYQHLSENGHFHYLGGALPLPRALARRAAELAVRAIASLPNPRGYIGIDMVLGSTQADDCVIEINPRITTSYVGLRAACRGNLAEAMLRIAQGESVELSFRDDPLQFDADGAVRFLQGQT